MSSFRYGQSPARGSASVELAAGPSVTVGDSPAVAVDPSADAPGQAASSGVVGGSTDIETVGAEDPASAGEAPSTPPAPVVPSSPHVSFADDVPLVPSNVAVVIRLPPLPAARQARDWCRRCLRFVGRDPSNVPSGFSCSFGNYASCLRCRLQTHQRCEPV